MTRTRSPWKRTAVLSAAIVALAACGGGGGGSTSTAQTQGTGTLRIALTDAPSCGFDQVNVTVDRVRVHQSAGAGESEAGWSEVRLDPPRKINLLTLMNGVLFDLGQTALPAGQYQQLRLMLVANAGSGSPANSVVPSGGAETALSTPSGMQSGIKMNHSFAVPAGTLVDLVLDFDACKSIVQQGNGRYQMKPVIKVIPMAVSGSVTGTVTTTISGTAVTQARVSAQKDGNVLRATVPDSSGSYTLSPIDSRFAPYEIVITMSGAATSVVTGVPVTIAGMTPVPAITLSNGSMMGKVSGTVGPAAALPATVRALEAVGTVPRVEVASGNTGGAGEYSMSLPKAAAQLATYSASALTFSALATATTAGKYTIVAADANDGTKVGTPNPVDIPLLDQTVNFTFP